MTANEKYNLPISMGEVDLPKSEQKKSFGKSVFISGVCRCGQGLGTNEDCDICLAWNHHIDNEIDRAREDRARPWKDLEPMEEW